MNILWQLERLPRPPSISLGKPLFLLFVRPLLLAGETVPNVGNRRLLHLDAGKVEPRGARVALHHRSTSERFPAKARDRIGVIAVLHFNGRLPAVRRFGLNDVSGGAGAAGAAGGSRGRGSGRRGLLAEGGDRGGGGRRGCGREGRIVDGRRTGRVSGEDGTTGRFFVQSDDRRRR